VLYVSGQSLDTTGCNHFKDLKQCSSKHPQPVGAPSAAKDRQAILRGVLDDTAKVRVHFAV